MEDTIVAISTGLTNSGIGIIRMSGKNAFSILDKIFIPKNKNKDIIGYTMKYGNVVDKANNEIIDEVLVSYFVSPKSYTRENMCEINSHGGIVVERTILNLCLKYGAKLAAPGEFTKRAFLNGRIDLSQAESIIELINSKTDKEAKESIKQLKGSLSNKVSEIENEMLKLISTIEVSIDYPEYDIEESKNLNALKELNNIKSQLDVLIKSFDSGKILKNGIKTVIIGKPNAGKSSLLNAILNEDRAIVSNVEGTTRDIIEESVSINGICLDLVDTAGIRETNNEIEKIGVEKAEKLTNEADLIIAIFDISEKLDDKDRNIMKIIKNKRALVVLNKVDINNKNKETEMELKGLNKPIIKISAKTKEGIDSLYREIEKLFNLDKICSNDESIITNERQKSQILKAKSDIIEAINSVNNNVPIDICEINIKNALEDIGEITGKNVSDDIINEIFKRFCVGK